MERLQNLTNFAKNVGAIKINEPKGLCHGQNILSRNGCSEQGYSYKDLNPRHVANEMVNIVKILSSDFPDRVSAAGPGNIILIPKHLIFPGRSVAPLIAAIEVMDDQIKFQSMTSFSISCFRRGPNDPLFDNILDQLHQHFEDSIPTKPFLDGNPITVVEYAQSGNSLLAVTYNLKKWLKSKGIRNQVTGFALCSPTSFMGAKKKFQVNRIGLHTAKFEHLDVDVAFQKAAFDSISSQIYFDIMQPPTAPN